VRRILLVIALNVGVIQSLVSMDNNFLARMEGPLNRPDTYSMIDECDITESLLIGPTGNDTLYWFFIEQTEETLQSQWAEIEPVLEPMLEQTWENCNNGWVEAPIVYAAKKGLYTFISHVLKKDKLIPDQAILDQALHGAVLYDHEDTVKLLLEHGANPNGYEMKKSAGSVSTLEASFVDLYGYITPTKPNYALVKLLICSGARQTEFPFDGVVFKWKECKSGNAGLEALYERMLLFNRHDLSLLQTCILHFVHNDDSAIAQIPIELIQAIMDARRLYRADHLLNLKNHN
jgi:hypothetical protein